MSREIQTFVNVKLEDIIDLDLEGFLDLLDELVNADIEDESARGILSNAGYKAIGVREDGSLVIEVIGELMTDEDTE